MWPSYSVLWALLALPHVSGPARATVERFLERPGYWKYAAFTDEYDCGRLTPEAAEAARAARAAAFELFHDLEAILQSYATQLVERGIL